LLPPPPDPPELEPPQPLRKKDTPRPKDRAKNRREFMQSSISTKLGLSSQVLQFLNSR
jgi:hypothetical protein